MNKKKIVHSLKTNAFQHKYGWELPAKTSIQKAGLRTLVVPALVVTTDYSLLKLYSQHVTYIILFISRKQYWERKNGSRYSVGRWNPVLCRNSCLQLECRVGRPRPFYQIFQRLPDVPVGQNVLRLSHWPFCLFVLLIC